MNDETRLLAGRQLFIRAVLDDVKAADADTRRRLEPLLAADEGVAGELPDGTRIGTVKRSKERRTAVVTDEAALLAWVEKHRPDEVMRSVNPAFVAALKATCKRLGEAVDVTTGEIVPGIEMTTGEPSYLPQLDPATVPMLRKKLAELIAGGLLELPSTQEGAA